MLAEIHKRSCAADGEAATAMTCLVSLSGGSTHCCRLPVKGARLGPSGHAVKRPLSLA